MAVTSADSAVKNCPPTNQFWITNAFILGRSPTSAKPVENHSGKPNTLTKFFKNHLTCYILYSRTYTARWAHVQRHKKGSFTCEHCGKVFRYKTDFLIKKIYQSKFVTFFYFSYKQNLLTHILIHMLVEYRKHQCTKCGKKFLRKGHLNIHMRIHNGDRPYTCDICNYSFT